MLSQKKKMGLMLAAVLILFILMLVKVMSRGSKEETPSEPAGNAMIDIPDGDVTEVDKSKTDAYTNANSGSRSIEDYWDECEDDIAVKNEDPVEAVGGLPAGKEEPVRKATSEELFGSSSGGGQSPRASAVGNPYRESAEEREARHQRRREEAIDLAEQMSGMGQEEESTPQEEIPERIRLGGQDGSGIISSFDDGWSDSGISSLDSRQSEPQEDEDRPIKCMFVREEKIKSGQRVPVRILENIVIGTTVIPKNTHVMATCSIGSRLNLELSSIEMYGRIIQLGFEAYDNDGTRGIYCPEAGEAVRTVKDAGLGMLGSAIGGRVGRIAGQVVQTGVSLAQSAAGERTVSVPSGYTFYIVRKKTP